MTGGALNLSSIQFKYLKVVCFLSFIDYKETLKMKKSKIIIPALAMIAFSVAAAATGTVAWFTANRTASLDAGTYAVVKTTSNLSVTLSDGVGAARSGGTSNEIIVVDGKLTDGSFNHLTGDIFEPNSEGSAIANTYNLSDQNLATELVRGETGGQDSVNIYTAVTFGMTFKVKFGAASNDIGLFLDLEVISNAAKSYFQVAGTPEPEAVTATGFRMAFYATNGGSTKVFADLQESAECAHMTSTSDMDGVAYQSGLIDIDTAAAIPTTSTLADYTGYAGYLGTFANSAKDENNEVTLSYTVVCWFEGTDPNIVNQDDDEDYQSVSAHLEFAAKDLPAAPAQGGGEGGGEPQNP